ncbi:HflK protein [Desulfosporosinus metallidurans]|uniref:Protein HflK n=2 Tax=Desulfosporosinus metallidurans TaxID=1888891 RepID=A0A1Q8QG40_9FIRM|nr:HflK protein [Desulfosporosinus metallidurans]
MSEMDKKPPEKDIKSILGSAFAKILGKLSVLLKGLKTRFQGLSKSDKDKGKISVLEDINRAFNHINPKKAGLGLTLGLLLVYIMTGIYIVNPGEQAVIRRFGSVLTESINEGMHYRLPWPIDKVEKVNVSEVRRADIGVSLPEHKHQTDAPQNIQLLTGDENITSSEAIVHYKVKDAAQYLYNVNSEDERLVRNSVESALVYLTASMGIDDILTSEKVKAQGIIMKKSQEILDSYNSGLQVTNFNIKSIVPPDEVSAAFRDVTTAKEDSEKEINQAKGFYNSLIPEARGKADEQISKAEAYKAESVNRAKGDAQRFETMLVEYQKNSQIYSQDTTKYRLFLETMEKILPKTKKFIVNPADGKVNLKLFDQAPSKVN